MSEKNVLHESTDPVAYEISLKDVAFSLRLDLRTKSLLMRSDNGQPVEIDLADNEFAHLLTICRRQSGYRENEAVLHDQKRRQTTHTIDLLNTGQKHDLKRKIAKRFDTKPETIFVKGAREPRFTGPVRSITRRDMDHERIQCSILSARQHIGRLPPLHGVFGRESEAPALLDRWIQDRHLIICGAPNIGKSTLAQVLIRELESNPEHGGEYQGRIYHIRCDGMQDMTSLFRSVARSWFGEGVGIADYPFELILRWLNEAPTAVLIDNYETFTEHDQLEVRQQSVAFLGSLKECPNLLLLVGMQGNVPPKGFSQGVMYTPSPLDSETCIKIFRYHASGRFPAATDDQLKDLLAQTGFNPFAARLLAGTIESDRDTFEALRDRWDQERGELLKAAPDVDIMSEEDRRKAMHVAYRVALNSLNNSPDALAGVFLLAALPSGLFDGQDSDIFLLAGFQSSSKDYVSRGNTVYKQIFRRALAYRNADTRRIMMLDPVRDVLLGLRKPYCYAAGGAGLYRRVWELTNNAVLAYCNSVLAAAELGKGCDSAILEEIRREFGNIEWAVRSFVRDAYSEFTDKGTTEDKLNSLRCLNKYCCWTGVGHYECDTLLDEFHATLSPHDTLAQASVSLLSAESLRMQSNLKGSTDKYKVALSILDNSITTEARKVRLSCMIGLAENLRDTFHPSESREIHLRNIQECIALGEERPSKGLPWRIAKTYAMEYLWDEANQGFNESLDKYGIPVDDLQGKGSCFRELGEIARFHQRFDVALDLFRKAEECYADTNGHNYVAMCRKEQLEVMVAMRSSDYAAMLDLERRSAEVLASIPKYSIEAKWCRWLKGGILKHGGYYAKAKQLWEEILYLLDASLVSTARQLFLPERLCDLYLWCCWSLMELEQPILTEDEIILYQAKMFHMWNQIDDVWVRAWKMKEMGDLAVKHGHLDKAMCLWRRAHDLFVRNPKQYPHDLMQRQMIWLSNITGQG